MYYSIDVCQYLSSRPRASLRIGTSLILLPRKYTPPSVYKLNVPTMLVLPVNCLTVCDDFIVRVDLTRSSAQDLRSICALLLPHVLFGVEDKLPLVSVDPPLSLKYEFRLSCYSLLQSSDRNDCARSMF